MNNILKLAALVGIITASGISAKMFYVTNNTPFPAQVTMTWPACSTDHFSVNPGQRVEVNGKACLLTSINADIHQSGTVNIGGIIYQAQYTGTVMTNMATVAKARPYTSSGGQSVYTEFHIMGPGVNGTYHIGRFVE